MWPTDPWEALRRIEALGGPSSYIARECIRRAPQPDASAEGREGDVDVVIHRLYAAARHIEHARKKLPDSFNHQEPNDILDAIALLRRLAPKAGDGPDAGETADQAMKLANFFEGVRVFVTTREKIKAPEGVDLFDEHVTKLILLAAKIRKFGTTPSAPVAGSDRKVCNHDCDCVGPCKRGIE